MFNPVKGSDNIMTVASKKKEQEKPSGDFGVNSIREKLETKFATLKEDYCISCDAKIPTGSDIDQCKKCYAKDHPKEAKKTVKEEVSKAHAKKLQAALDNLEAKVKKLGAPPSAKTKISQSMERFTDKIEAIKDALAKAKGEDKSEESDEKPEPKKSEGKTEEKTEKKSEKPSEKEETTKSEGKEAEPKPKEQKETASDEPDTNGDDKAPKGKVKDIGKGIYESESAKMESLRQIIIEGMGE